MWCSVQLNTTYHIDMAFLAPIIGRDMALKSELSWSAWSRCETPPKVPAIQGANSRLMKALKKAPPPPQLFKVDTSTAQRQKRKIIVIDQWNLTWHFSIEAINGISIEAINGFSIEAINGISIEAINGYQCNKWVSGQWTRLKLVPGSRSLAGKLCGMLLSPQRLKVCYNWRLFIENCEFIFKC